MDHSEHHSIGITAWLRAAVLGANDGVVSTASLVLGVASADPAPGAVVTAGLVGLIGGALSMAAGEYVSVSSQRDVECADLARERQELAEDPERELEELTGLLRGRGVPDELAADVAIAMTERDALAAHAHVELGIELDSLARPLQAGLVSAASFAVGAAVPLLAIALSPPSIRLWITLTTALIVLGTLGGWSARLGGAPIGRAMRRVLVGGTLAMGLTMALGHVFGAAI